MSVSLPSEPEGRGNVAPPTRSVAERATLLVDRLSIVLACLGALAMGCVITLSTILRYAFSSGLFWAGEFVSLVFPWLVMFGAILAYNRDMHIRVELLAHLLPDRWRLALARGIDIVIAVTSLFVALTSGRILTIASNQALSTLGVPLSWSYAALPAGFGLLGLLAAFRTLGLVSTQDRGPDAGGDRR